MAREPSPGEIAEDLVDIRRELSMLRHDIGRDYVRTDLHNEQIGSIRTDIAKLDKSTTDGFASQRTLILAILTLLGSFLVGAVVLIISTISRGAL